MLSSMPGVSNHSSASPPSMRRRAPSTWRVVPGLSATSPKRVSRVSVRSSEVLPVLVCPTTAMRIRESAMSGLQPVQRVGGCRQHGLRGQAQRRELRAPRRARAGPSSCAGSSSQTRVCCACAASSAISVSVPRSGVWRASQAIRRREAAASASASRMRRRSSRVSSRPAIWMPAGLWPAARAGRWAVPAPAAPDGRPARQAPARTGAARAAGRRDGQAGGDHGGFQPVAQPAWPGSAGSMRRPASLRRSTTRHSSAAASRGSTP